MANKSKLKEDYRFAKEFLRDLSDDKHMHHLAVERGYIALAGKSAVQVGALVYLVSLISPDKCIRDFTSARNYLEFDSEEQKVVFKSRYRSRAYRLYLKFMYGGLYFTMGGLAVAPYVFLDSFDFVLQRVLLDFVTLSCLGYFSIKSLLAFINIRKGEMLVRDQKKYVRLSGE